MLQYFSKILAFKINRYLLITLIFGILVRSILFFTQSGILWADSIAYYAWAVRIADSLDFSAYPFFRTPFYSIFLSLFLSLGEDSFTGELILLAQYFLGILTVYYLYKIAKIYFSEAIATTASLLFSLNVLQLYYETVIQTEALFCFLLVLTSYQSLKLIEYSDNKKNLFYLGFLIGLLTLTRPIGRLFFIVVIICSFIKNKSFKQTLKNGSLVFLFYYLTIAPWLFVNYYKYNYWGLSLDMGINLFHRSIDVDKLPLLQERDYKGIERTITRHRKKHKASYFTVLHNLQKHKKKALEIDKMLSQYSLKVIQNNFAHYLQNSIIIFGNFFFSPRESVGFCHINDLSKSNESIPYLCSTRSKSLTVRSFNNYPEANYPKLNHFVFSAFNFLKPINKIFLIFSYLGFICYVVGKNRNNIFAIFSFLTVGYFSIITALLNRAEDRMVLPLHFLFYIFCAYFIWTALKMIFRFKEKTGSLK